MEDSLSVSVAFENSYGERVKGFRIRVIVSYPHQSLAGSEEREEWASGVVCLKKPLVGISEVSLHPAVNPSKQLSGTERQSIQAELFLLMVLRVRYPLHGPKFVL